MALTLGLHAIWRNLLQRSDDVFSFPKPFRTLYRPPIFESRRKVSAIGSETGATIPWVNHFLPNAEVVLPREELRMSNDPSSPPPEPAEPETWSPLSLWDRRVLGVLIEKQKTSKSPDAYPMSVNSITTGCNQKSNRDPVLNLDEDEVEQSLTRLQGGGLVSKITGGRVVRWRHLLYENWKVGKTELAILAELMMRGPQTEGDLRVRASRMDDIADLDVLKSLLDPLVARHLVVYLTERDRRGAMLTHGFHPPEELEAAKATFGSGGSPAPMPRVPSSDVVSEFQAKLKIAFEEIATLRSEVQGLRDEVKKLQAELGS
jgi:uncharacterized protein